LQNQKMRQSERHRYLRLIAEEILGGRDPMKIRAEHGINYHSWARWCRQVRENPKVLLEMPIPEEPKRPTQQPKLPLRGALAASRRANRAIANAKDSAPALPSGSTLSDPIDLMAQVHHMLKVCDELDRAGRDEDGQINIDGGPIVNEALKRRRETLQMVARVCEDWWSVSRLEEVHRVMIERIAQADRSVAREIVAGLREIDRKFGLSVGAFG
jgi:hypothetical protein